MARNLTPNHFDYAGIYVEGKRSAFRFRKPHHASFMSGMLVPLGDPIPVFPGTKLDLNINAVIRSNTMVAPPLDPMFVDFFTVFVPHRIIWNHFPQFLGENDTTAWTQALELTYPTFTLADTNTIGYFSDQLASGDDVLLGNISLLEHYGLTSFLMSNKDDIDINVMAIRGYYAIWNYLFRDENYQRPVLISKGDSAFNGENGYFLINYKIAATDSNGNHYHISDVLQGLDSIGLEDLTAYPELACLMPVNKLHDAFTSVLPQPQYGDPVEIGLGGEADIVAGSSLTALGNTLMMGFSSTELSNNGHLGLDESGVFADTTTTGLGQEGRGIGYTNLKAKLSTATAVTINQLRASIMTQRYLEALARSGRRVPEYYEAIYGVKNSAAGHDYPELITRARYVLGVNQVVATADATGEGWTSRLGDTGAYSLTSLRNIPCCEKDFTEFGYLHILYCVRAELIYSQMIQPHFLRKTLMDEFNPYFDHIGDVAIPNYVVNTDAGSAGNFGYQEAWWDERTQLGLSVGALNKKYGSLKYWVIGETYGSSLTTCTPSFLAFDPSCLDDIFVSNYNVYPQFIGDFLIHGRKVARMSQHSIPGIVGRI